MIYRKDSQMGDKKEKKFFEFFHENKEFKIDEDKLKNYSVILPILQTVLGQDLFLIAVKKDGVETSDASTKHFLFFRDERGKMILKNEPVSVGKFSEFMLDSYINYKVDETFFHNGKHVINQLNIISELIGAANEYSEITSAILGSHILKYILTECRVVINNSEKILQANCFVEEKFSEVREKQKNIGGRIRKTFNIFENIDFMYDVTTSSLDYKKYEDDYKLFISYMQEVKNENGCGGMYLLYLLSFYFSQNRRMPILSISGESGTGKSVIMSFFSALKLKGHQESFFKEEKNGQLYETTLVVLDDAEEDRQKFFSAESLKSFATENSFAIRKMREDETSCNGFKTLIMLHNNEQNNLVRKTLSDPAIDVDTLTNRVSTIHFSSENKKWFKENIINAKNEDKKNYWFGRDCKNKYSAWLERFFKPWKEERNGEENDPLVFGLIRYLRENKEKYFAEEMEKEKGNVEIRSGTYTMHMIPVRQDISSGARSQVEEILKQINFLLNKNDGYSPSTAIMQNCEVKDDFFYFSFVEDYVKTYWKFASIGGAYDRLKIIMPSVQLSKGTNSEGKDIRLPKTRGRCDAKISITEFNSVAKKYIGCCVNFPLERMSKENEIV